MEGGARTGVRHPESPLGGSEKQGEAVDCLDAGSILFCFLLGTGSVARAQAGPKLAEEEQDLPG